MAEEKWHTMSRAQVPNMTRGSAYPSPSAAQMAGGAPFYTNQPGQLPHQIATGRSASYDDGSEIVHAVHPQSFQELQQAQHASPQLVHSQVGTPEPAAKKPRSKVSRACDECRRKKIRCDANLDTPGIACTNCRKPPGVNCEFTRPPGKRGPNKGYIRDLAERVDALEGSAMNNQPMSPQGFQGYPIQPDEAGYGSRKRTYSISEGLHNGAYMRSHFDGSNGPYMPTQWNNQLTSRQTLAPQSLPVFRAQDRAQDLQPTDRYADANHDDHAARMSSDGALSATQTTGDMGVDKINPHTTEHDSHMEADFEWNEQAVKDYYDFVHPVYHILPHTRTKLKMSLAKASATVRDALLCVLNASANLPEPQMGSNLKKAAEQLVACQLEDLQTRSTSDNLIYLQALLLMGLASDSSGPSQVQQSLWINLAFGVSVFLKLHCNRRVVHVVGSEFDTNEKLGRRAWLALFMMDRWHASGTGGPFVIREKMSEIYEEDGALLGNVGIRLARLTLKLEYIMDARVCLVSRATAGLWLRDLACSGITSQLDRFREYAEPMMASSPVLYLAYWHVKLVFEQYYMLGQVDNVGEITGIAFRLTNHLCSNPGPTSPLAYHFVALTAAALINAFTAINPNKDNIKRAMDDLWTGLEEGRILPRSSAAPDKPGWGVAIQNAIAKKLASTMTEATTIDRGGLQHLADAAVGESENLGGEKAKEGGASGGEVEVGEPSGREVTTGYFSAFF